MDKSASELDWVPEQLFSLFLVTFWLQKRAEIEPDPKKEPLVHCIMGIFPSWADRNMPGNLKKTVRWVQTGTRSETTLAENIQKTELFLLF